MLAAGTILAQRYEIAGRVGSGGMADVYKAKDHKLNRYVAVKVMKPEFREDGTFISKFRREAQAAAGLANPNIVNVFDVGEDNGNYYIVMELVEGITLKEYISKKGKLSVREATSIAIQVCMGLAAAHAQGIVHRDVKPQNIIISTDGKVKVTDFGIARAASSNTISSNAMGSVHYSSPEQVRGGYSDSRSDIYSLGITLYEMVTGRVPFDGETTVAIAIKHLQDEMDPPSRYTPELPYALEQIIYKCTQKSVDRRYQTMNDVIADLKKSLVEPQGHFVTLTPLSDHANTAMVTEEERAEINAKAPEKPKKGEAEKRTYASTEAAKKAAERRRDIYDDEDEEEDDDDDEGAGGILEKLLTVAGFLIGALIIAILIYFIAQAAGLINFGGSSSSSSVVESVTETPTETPTPTPTETPTPTPTETPTPTPTEVVPETIDVPELVGLTEDAARTAANSKGLGIQYLGEEHSDIYPAGTVIHQEPEAGSQVELNSSISYYLSAGPAGTAVPAVAGQTQENAIAILNSAGFSNVSVAGANSDTVTAGVVISVNPAAGELIQKTDTVTIVVSAGPANPPAPTQTPTESTDTTTVPVDPNTSVTVYSYTGLPEAQATNAAKRDGLNVKIEYGTSDEVEKGEVYAQSIANGTPVTAGTEIVFQVNGKAETTEAAAEAAPAANPGA